MSYVSSDYKDYVDTVVGDGQCVAYVRKAASAPATAQWSEGTKVKGQSGLAPGTAIATFQNGHYTNSTNGDSHAAIYESQDSKGLWVYDQWTGHPVSKRQIRFKGGVGTPNNDGDAFSVIE